MNTDFAAQYEILRMRRHGAGAQNFRLWDSFRANPSDLKREFITWVRAHVVASNLHEGSETFLLRNVVTGSITPYRVSLPTPALEIERVEL